MSNEHKKFLKWYFDENKILRETDFIKLTGFSARRIQKQKDKRAFPKAIKVPGVEEPHYNSYFLAQWLTMKAAGKSCLHIRNTLELLQAGLEKVTENKNVN